MLLRMADKVVEEEKRNCDFFDVFSIFTSTINSKKEKNLQELCLAYYRYSDLEMLGSSSDGLLKEKDQNKDEVKRNEENQESHNI